MPPVCVLSPDGRPKGLQELQPRAAGGCAAPRPTPPHLHACREGLTGTRNKEKQRMEEWREVGACCSMP